jgi:hypothetical protein
MGSSASVQLVTYNSKVYAREAYRTVQGGLKETTRKARRGIELAKAINRKVPALFCIAHFPFFRPMHNSFPDICFSGVCAQKQLDLTGSKRKKAIEAARDERKRKLRMYHTMMCIFH